MQANVLVFLDEGLILTQACSKLHLMQKVNMYFLVKYFEVVILACSVVSVSFLDMNVILG